jgi:hypothetical protein
MPRTTIRFQLAGRVTQLLKDRDIHQKAVDAIDSTLEAIEKALGVSLNSKGRGRPAKIKGKRTRGRFIVTAEQLILSFIQSHKGAVTADINKHWKAQGRKGDANNTLTKMVKDKKLKRTKVEGRGSSYSVV